MRRRPLAFSILILAGSFCFFCIALIQTFATSAFAQNSCGSGHGGGVQPMRENVTVSYYVPCADAAVTAEVRVLWRSGAFSIGPYAPFVDTARKWNTFTWIR